MRSPIGCTAPSQTSAKPHCIDEESEACRDSRKFRRGNFRDPPIIGLACTVSLSLPPLSQILHQALPQEGGGVGGCHREKASWPQPPSALAPPTPEIRCWAPAVGALTDLGLRPGTHRACGISSAVAEVGGDWGRGNGAQVRISQAVQRKDPDQAHPWEADG